MLSVEDRRDRTKYVNWQMGKYIVETEQNGEVRAEYGENLLSNLAEALKKELGSGFSERSLQYSRGFYTNYDSPHLGAELTWSHYRTLLSLQDVDLRSALEQKAIAENMTKDELIALVKLANLEAKLGKKNRSALVPRRAQLNLCKVVRRIYGHRKALALDLGFYATEPLSSQRAKNFSDGDHVRWTGTETDFRLEKVQCKKGERYCYHGHVQRVVDGDTLLVDVVLSNGRRLLQRFRLRGVLAMELGTQKGEQCKRFVSRLIRIGTKIKLLTYGKDRYGRYVADVFLGELFVNQRIIEKGLG